MLISVLLQSSNSNLICKNSSHDPLLIIKNVDTLVSTQHRLRVAYKVD